MRKGWLALGAVLVASAAHAQIELTGKDQFPQFRTLSALPGGSYAVTADGRLDMRGAMSLSTPVAYSLNNWRVAFGIANVAASARPNFRFRGGRDLTGNGNGTGQVSFGVPLRSMGSATVGVGVLSGLGDNVINVHWQPPKQDQNKVVFGVGVQDLFDDGGAAGENLPGDRDSSQSLYAVGTWKASRELYVSAGVGTRRFKGAFANASYGVTPWAKATLEYDTFNWNYGLGIDLGEAFSNRSREWEPETSGRGSLIMHVGMIRGKYFYAAFNVTF